MELQKRMSAYQGLGEIEFIKALGFKSKQPVYNLAESENSEEENFMENSLQEQVLKNSKIESELLDPGLPGCIVIIPVGSKIADFTKKNSLENKYFDDYTLMKEVEMMDDLYLRNKDVMSRWRQQTYPDFIEILSKKLLEGKFVLFDPQNYTQLCLSFPFVKEIPAYCLNVIYYNQNSVTKEFEEKLKEDISIIVKLANDQAYEVVTSNFLDEGLQIVEKLHLQNMKIKMSSSSREFFNENRKNEKVDYLNENNQISPTISKKKKEEEKDEVKITSPKICFVCHTRPVFLHYLRCETCKTIADDEKKARLRQKYMFKYY
jgi:hypothetical protein